MRRAFRLAGPLAASRSARPRSPAARAPGLILTAAGIATDTSMTWEMAKHVHAQLTEDDPTPCALLNSVQRALNGALRVRPRQHSRADIARSGLQALPAHRRDARRAPVAGPAGADREGRAARALRRARRSQDLAEVDACPDFQAASPEVAEGDRLPRRQRPARGPPRRLSHAQLPAARAPSASTRCSSAGSTAASCSRARSRSARSRRSTPTCS